jgi:Flavin containing amine oxidoreductase
VEWNGLLSAATSYGRTLREAPVSSKIKSLSLGEGLAILIRREKLTLLREAREFMENELDMMKVLTLCYEERTILQAKLDQTVKDFLKAKADLAATSENKAQWNYRLARAHLIEADDKMKDLIGRIKQWEKMLQGAADTKVEPEYLGADGRAVIGWHEANLEFANANHLDGLSLAEWDQDDEHELAGGHFMVPSGMSKLPEALAQGLDIIMDCEVIKIDTRGKRPHQSLTVILTLHELAERSTLSLTK